MSLFEDGDFEGSIEIFQDLLREDPSNDLLRYNLAISWFSNGNYQDALPEMEAFIEAYPDDLYARFTYAVMLFRQADYQNAGKNFDLASADSLLQEASICYLGLCAYSESDYKLAGQTLSNCANDSNQAAVVNLIAASCLMIEEYDLAVAYLEKAIKEEPSNSHSYLDRGIAYYHLNEFERAYGDFSVCIELNPELKKAYTYRGLCEKEMGNLEEAIADLKNGGTDVSEMESRYKKSSFISRHWYNIILLFILLILLLGVLLSGSKGSKEEGKAELK